MTSCDSRNNRRFGGTFRRHYQSEKNQGDRNNVTAYVVHSSLIRLTLLKEQMHSSETVFLTRATRRHITEDGIVHFHCRENLKSYIPLIGCIL
jgi:hypothetical protein